MKLIFLGFSLLFAYTFFAQNKLTGRILDHINQEAIPFANIEFLEISQLTQSDQSGYFQLEGNFPSKMTLVIQASGYEILNLVLTELPSTPLMIELDLTHITDVDEVKVDTKSLEISNRHMFSVDYQKLSNLNRISTLNLGEALAKIPGVYQSTTGNGISKPVIRGMQGMRVVTYLNGLRIEGQQWGSDHGLGISDIGIGSVEVIKGPASLYYGADALGGVLYFVDEPYALNGKKSLELKQTLHSASLGSTTRFLWKQSGAKYRGIFGMSYTSHADFKLPNGQFAFNTRFSELSWKGSISWNSAKSVQYVRVASNQMKIGIPGESSDSLLIQQGFQTDQQGRMAILPTQYFQNHSISFEKKWFLEKHELSLLIGQTLNRLLEFEESFSEKAMNMNLWNTNYQLKWMKSWNDKFQMTTGIQGMMQVNQNNPKAEEILMPNARSVDQGCYSVWKWQPSKNLTLTAGLRADIRKLQSLDSLNGIAPLNRIFASPNGSIGMRVDPNKKMSGQVSLSTGYRAPHLTELLANGFHHGALRYEIGSIQLKSERAFQLDGLVNFKTTHFEWSINPFYTYFNHFIYLNPIDSMIGGMPVFRYEQLNKIQMLGIDLKLHYHVHRIDKLHMESNFSMLHYLDADQTVSLVPPPRLAHALTYQVDYGKKWKFTSVAVEQSSFFQQNQVAKYEKKSKFYQIVNVSLHASHIGKHPMEIELSVKNLFNQTYIDHLSRLKNIGLPSQGRSVILGIKWKIT